MRILVVDDNTDLADMLGELLVDALGPATIAEVAYDGAAGLRLALANPPSAVVMDLDMPIMSGEDAAILMRAALPVTQHLTVVAITGRMPRDVGAMGVFDRVLLKPIEIDDLVSALTR